MGDYREISLWRDVPAELWQDWKWQMRHRLRTREELSQIINLTAAETAGIANARDSFSFGVTPYYAALMDPDNPQCPIRQQAVPVAQEKDLGNYDLFDPLDEDADSPVPFLTHRYPDRVLLLVTEMCATYCRHCTRRRLVGAQEGGIPKEALHKALDYIRATPEVNDVLISGGDPFSLSASRLDYILTGLRQIPHVGVIRFGTRMPVTNPFRITPELVETLRRHHPIWVNTHFNHPRELTDDAISSCARLADAGIPLGNQTVLLRGINDCGNIQKELVKGLVKARVRPYYLYQCDLSQGLEHFRTPIAKGVEIIEYLRGHISGYAVPTFVVDAPGGGGKIPVSPQYVLSQSPSKTVLRNYEGRIVAYPEPAIGETHDSEACQYCQQAQESEGVAGLLGRGGPLVQPPSGPRQWSLTPRRNGCAKE